MPTGRSISPSMLAARPATGPLLRVGSAVSELEVVVLGWMLCVGGLFAVGGSRFSARQDARQLILGIGILSVVIGAVTLWRRNRMSGVGVHLGLVLGALMVTLISATTDNAAAMGAGACFVVWIGIYAACFFTRRQTVVHLGLALVMLSVALSITWSDPVIVLLVVVSAAVNSAVAAACVGWLSVQLRRNATLDALTGLANTAAWRETLRSEIERSERTGAPFTVVFIDVDGLKSVNDRGGHAAGDELLASVAECLRLGVRRCDTVARVGGDEFMIALPDTTQAAAEAMMDRLRRESPASFSVGVAQRRADEGPASLVERADAEMYRRKRRRAAEAAEAAARAEGEQRPHRVG